MSARYVCTTRSAQEIEAPRVAFSISTALIRIGPNNQEAHVPSRLTYTVPEVAELLGISRSSAYECVRRGDIPALTLGRRVVIAKTAIDALLGIATSDPEVPAVGEERL